MARLGAWFALIGVLILAVVLGNTAYAIFGSQQACPPRGVKAPATGFVGTSDTKFGSNDQLCIAWRPKAYFAQEVLVRTEQEAAVKKAKTARDAAEAALVAATATAAADKPARETALKTAQTDLAGAETKLAALPKDAQVILFIEDKPTEIGFTARLPQPADADLWEWRPIRLRASEDHKSEAAKAWREVLSGVSLDGSRPVKVGLGDFEAKLPRAGASIEGLHVSAFERAWLVAGGVGFLLTMASLVMLGWRTRMLRVRKPDTDEDDPIFSLARVQMVWWFMLSLAGFLFIWLTTGQWIGVMTPAVVGLLGISGVSGLAAVAIDTTPATAPTAEAHGAQSKGFFTDILSDGETIALHRVQMFAWTVVLGLIFVWTVVAKYTLPEFDPTLLALTGIVNGLYLGFKFPENKATAAAAAQDDGA